MMKPCPFCGHDTTKLDSWRVIYHDVHMEYAFVCQNCGARGPNDVSPSRAEEMWNLRRPEAALRQRLAEAERQRDKATQLAESRRIGWEGAIAIQEALERQRDELAAALRAVDEAFVNGSGPQMQGAIRQTRAALTRLEGG